MKPYTKSDLVSISLPNIIRDYSLTATQKIPVNPLVYLYPDIPKDDAFGRYYISSSDGRYSLFNHSFQKEAETTDVNSLLHKITMQILRKQHHKINTLCIWIY